MKLFSKFCEPFDRRPRQGTCLAEATAGMERWLRTKAERLKRPGRTRAELRRSLRMHRRLVIVMAVGAAAAEATWLFASQFIAHGASGAYGLRAVANPTSITVYAALLILTPGAAGLMAAMVASKLDPRIYDGADVERLLSVSPMGELPDFAEAPGEYGEVDLLRLANGIAHSSKKGRTRRYVFTGTGHGAGVTTVALRVKESLDALGRVALLVDATGAPHPAVAPSAAVLQAAGLSAAGELTGENGKGRDELVITDAEPIATSADTEYLARFADCVLVVIESGVTTRAELRRTVSCLEKLNVFAVQYVVNRVKQAHSSRRLSESAATLGFAPGQFAAAVRRALTDAPHRDEEDSKPRRAAVRAATTADAPEAPETAVTLKKQAAEPLASDAPGRSASGRNAPGWDAPGWNAPGIPAWLSAALSQLEKEETQRPAAQERAQATPGVAESSDEVMAPESNEAREQDGEQQQEALPFEDHLKGKESYLSEAEAMLFSMDMNRSMRENGPTTAAGGAENLPPEGPMPEKKGLGAEKQSPGAEKQSAGAEKKPSRLSGLRGMVTAAELRALNQPGTAEATRWPVADPQQAVPSSLIEALTETAGRLTGLKGIVTPADLKELTQGRPQAAEANGGGDHAQSSAGDAMAPEPRIVEVALAPEPDDGLANVAEKAASRNAKSDAVPSKPPESVRSGRDNNFGEIQILPSRRGQYGRKK
jgi:hypothetical protein